MINIIIHYRDSNTPAERIKAAYTKIRGNFFCIHFMTEKEEPFRSKLIPADLINFVEQVDSSKRSKDDSERED